MSVGEFMCSVHYLQHCCCNSSQWLTITHSTLKYNELLLFWSKYNLEWHQWEGTQYQVRRQQSVSKRDKVYCYWKLRIAGSYTIEPFITTFLNKQMSLSQSCIETESFMQSFTQKTILWLCKSISCYIVFMYWMLNYKEVSKGRETQ